MKGVDNRAGAAESETENQDSRWSPCDTRTAVAVGPRSEVKPAGSEATDAIGTYNRFETKMSVVNAGEARVALDVAASRRDPSGPVSQTWLRLREPGRG